MLYHPRHDHPDYYKDEREPVVGVRAHLAELGAVAAAAVAAGVHSDGEHVGAVKAAYEDRDQQAPEAAGTGEGAALVEGDAAGRLGAGEALDLLYKDRDELYGYYEDEYELVDGDPEPLQRPEDQLEAVGQIYQRGSQHQHGGDVVEEDHAQPQYPGRAQSLGRDREHPPAPQVARLRRISLIEEDLEEQDEDEEAEEEGRPPQDVREGYAGDYLDQHHKPHRHGEALEAVYQERGDEHHEDRRELDPWVHPVDERPRIHELPEDDVSLQLEH